jgi:predicted HicB family RNase H-like nuclease
MLIGGRKTLHYSDTLLIRIDPGLRAALAAAAQREGKPMSEIVRQNVRAALTGSALTVPGGGDAHAQSAH